jgi:hypothetical protein
VETHRDSPYSYESAAHPLVQLHRSIGNQRVGRLLQAKLKVNHPNDVYEQEADRVTEQVLQMKEAPCSCGGSCAHCKEKKKNLVQRKTDDSGGGKEIPVPDSFVSELGPGAPLDRATRTFFEHRFGNDFSQVRVHTDRQAADSASAVNALAYTVGRDVVFGEGQYAPHTQTGRRLMAHELTHVVQVEGEDSGVLRRMSMGAGTPPVWGGGMTLATVPSSDLARVQEAIALVSDVATNQDRYPRCHDYFARNCTGHSQTALLDTFNRAVLWKLTDPTGNALARGGTDGNMGYTQSGYNEGAYQLATTLTHEMMHVCGVSGGDEHFKADVASVYCIGAGRNQFTIRAGPASGGIPPVVLYGYRRFLANWASGHIQPSLGLDLNLTGLLSEAVPASSFTPRLAGGEFGSLTLGTQWRPGWPWGGERYGGFTLGAEAGPSIGRFNLRAPRPGEVPGTAVAGGVVLQIGLGAEFYIPTSSGRIYPFSLDAAYRLVQPLNAEAERIHAVVFGASISF